MKRISEYYLSLNDYHNEDFLTLSKMAGVIAIIHTFDDDGRKIETEYLNDGEQDYKTFYKYNSQNQLVESFDIKPAGEITRICVSFYNKKGLLSEYLEFRGNMEFLIFRYNYAYDDQNNLISETYIDGDEISGITTFYSKSNANSNESTLISKNRKGEMTEKIVETQDDNGNLILARHYNSANVLLTEYKYYYDKHGNQTKQIINTTSDSGEEEIIIHNYKYTYDENNNWIKCIHNARQGSESLFLPSVIVRKVKEA